MRVGLGGDGRAERFEHLLRVRTFEADRGKRIGDVFEFHLIGDDVAADVPGDLLAQFRFGIDQEVVVETEEGEVCLDSALGAEEEGVGAASGRHFLNFVGREVVEEAGAVAAAGEDAGARREIEERGGIVEGVVTGRHTSMMPQSS